jgi:UDP-2,3-diacylglucosamine pyrophosphatase LpxH
LEIGSKNIILSENKPLNIFFIGDIHEGAINCQHEQLTEAVKIIAKTKKENENTKTVLMGDLIDCIVHSDKKRFNPVEFDHYYKIHDLIDLPQKQAERVNKFLDPIKDTVEIILIGNHEEEYIKRHNFNIYKNFYEKYPNAVPLGYVGLFRYNVQVKSNESSFSFDLALNHGKIKSVEKTFAHFDADINIEGHGHRLYAEPIEVISLNYLGTDLKKQFKWWGMSGGFLKTYVPGNRNYFEANGSKPSDIGMLRAEIKIHRKRTDGKRLWVKDIKLDRIFL